MVKLQVHNIQVERTARYFSSERPASCREIVLALHGYAQSAAAFALEVSPALRSDQWLVAPEGLSRFYRRGVYGDVVASWMTREDRESEIKDQCGYLDPLMVQLDQICPNAKLRVLAFSQGVATACRWMSRWTGQADQLILWAGTPPEDEWLLPLASKLIKPAVLIAGNQDEYISAEALQQTIARLDKLGFPYTIHRFEGRHGLNTDLLSALLRQDHSGEG